LIIIFIIDAWMFSSSTTPFKRDKKKTTKKKKNKKQRKLDLERIEGYGFIKLQLRG
jgi:hypothetical protein